MKRLDNLREFVNEFSTAPTIEKMQRRGLQEKGIYGPTGAHVIEEIHTPFNLAYVTITTGSTAFQNIVGVTESELVDRVHATERAFELTGIKKGAKILFTYPPLVNVFSKQALDAYGVKWGFLKASSRDAFILSLCEERPDVVVGESSFLRAALEDVKKLGVEDLVPDNVIYLTAGTPLDLDLLTVVSDMKTGRVHDLYGCQEFGWLTLDGIPLRRDITMIPVEDTGYFDLIVGGLPTGDRFPILEKGHVCCEEGKIITYNRVRTEPDYEVTILETTAAGKETVERLAKTILRIKAKIVRVGREIKLNSERTVLSLSCFESDRKPVIISDGEKTSLFDSLLKAQMDYQSMNKSDPAWIKRR